MVDQQRRTFRHSPTHARRTISAALTRERDSQLVAALAAHGLHKATLEVPAPRKLLELSLDELGQRVTALLEAREEARQMLSHEHGCVAVVGLREAGDDAVRTARAARARRPPAAASDGSRSRCRRPARRRRPWWPRCPRFRPRTRRRSECRRPSRRPSPRCPRCPRCRPSSRCRRCRRWRPSCRSSSRRWCQAAAPHRGPARRRRRPPPCLWRLVMWFRELS